MSDPAEVHLRAQMMVTVDYSFRRAADIVEPHLTLQSNAYEAAVSPPSRDQSVSAMQFLGIFWLPYIYAVVSVCRHGGIFQFTREQKKAQYAPLKRFVSSDVPAASVVDKCTQVDFAYKYPHRVYS